MIREWLGKLKTALNPPPPPDFLLDDELGELEEELPALAKTLRAQQTQITELKRHASRKAKLSALGAVGIVLLGAWMFRYEPMRSSDASIVMLDRWTGNLLVTSNRGPGWVDVQSFDTKRKGDKNE